MPELQGSRRKLKVVIVALVAVDVIAIAVLISPLVGSAESRREQIQQLSAELRVKTHAVEPLRGMDKKVVVPKTRSLTSTATGLVAMIPTSPVNSASSPPKAVFTFCRQNTSRKIPRLPESFQSRSRAISLATTCSWCALSMHSNVRNYFLPLTASAWPVRAPAQSGWK